MNRNFHNLVPSDLFTGSATADESFQDRLGLDLRASDAARLPYLEAVSLPIGRLDVITGSTEWATEAKPVPGKNTYNEVNALPETGSLASSHTVIALREIAVGQQSDDMTQLAVGEFASQAVPAIADDYPADPTTQGTVSVGGSATGNVEIGGDTDWFAANLTAGVSYRIDLEGQATGQGTLYDPYFRGVYDAAGVWIPGTSNDDSWTSLNSQLVFTPTASGTYYLAAGGYGSSLGTYRLSVIEVVDDYPAGMGGFVINGQCANDTSGRSVSAAGDVNGDGLADLIVGAERSDPAAGTDAGRSYVVFGKTGGGAVDLSAIAAGSGGFVINGQCAGDYSGCSVATAGDVNGDGLADLVVGASGSDPVAGSAAGCSYVIFGKADGGSVDLSTIGAGSGGFVINGQCAVDFNVKEPTLKANEGLTATGHGIELRRIRLLRG